MIWSHDQSISSIFTNQNIHFTICLHSTMYKLEKKILPIIIKYVHLKRTYNALKMYKIYIIIINVKD